MRHLSAILVKFLLTAVVMSIVLPIFSQATLGSAASAAFAVTVVSYWVGDLAVLPRMGNLIATAGDWLVAAGVLFASQFFLPGLRISALGSLSVALLIAATEWFYHRFLQRFIV